MYGIQTLNLPSFLARSPAFNTAYLIFKKRVKNNKIKGVTRINGDARHWNVLHVSIEGFFSLMGGIRGVVSSGKDSAAGKRSQENGGLPANKRSSIPAHYPACLALNLFILLSINLKKII